MDELWLTVLGCVGVTLIVTTGSVFEGLRSYLKGFRKRLNPLRVLGDLLSCSMCFGFWVGFLWRLLVGGDDVLQSVMWGGLISLLAYSTDLVIGFIEVLAGRERDE